MFRTVAMGGKPLLVIALACCGPAATPAGEASAPPAGAATASSAPRGGLHAVRHPTHWSAEPAPSASAALGSRRQPPSFHRPAGHGWWCFSSPEGPKRARACYRAHARCLDARDKLEPSERRDTSCIPESLATCVATLNNSDVHCFGERRSCEAWVASRPAQMPLSACVLWD